jgi:acyl carrier protein
VDARQTALDLMARLGGVEPDTLTPDMELVGDLGIDSPKALQLVVELEDTLQIEISDDALPNLNTVGDVLDEIARLRG